LLVVVLLVSSLLNAAYFFPIVYRGFFVAPATTDGTSAEIQEAPLLCVLPLSVTALCSLLLFFWPDVLLRLVQLVVAP
jgi:multicomponent Na+:H+ antiporter subunit D